MGKAIKRKAMNKNRERKLAANALRRAAVEASSVTPAA